MPEAFSHAEGALYLWTGSATASALVGYCQNYQQNAVRGWLNEPRGDLSYRDAATGRRADISVGAFYTSDATLMKLFQSATAVHVHFREFQTGVGSAGWLFYSGRIDSLSTNSNEGGVVSYALAYHSNSWSAY